MAPSSLPTPAPAASHNAPTSSPSSIDTPPTPILTLPKCLIRPYHTSDIPALAAAANSPLISRYMRNTFPHPYTLADAEYWVSLCTTSPPPTLNFALCRRDASGAAAAYAGGIGLRRLGDTEARTMEVGYWVGEAHWGQGVATEALVGFTAWAFEAFPDVLRLEAGVYGGNEGSKRVLAKAGYVFEGTRRSAGCKDGRVFDIHMFAVIRSDLEGEEGKVES